MSRLILLGLLVSAPMWGMAQECAAIKGDTARLACYDTLSGCAAISNPAERLGCFDRGHVASAPEIVDTPVPAVASPVAAPPAPAMAQKEEATPAEERDDFGVKRVRPDEIRTSIVGEFDGWNGSERFEMANGQIWEHRKSTRRVYPSVMNPKVLIRKNLFGFYMMDVEGAGATLPVKRIK